MEFVAIDFETANRRPDSACQVAAVVVRNSRIVAERAWLIRPPSNDFNPIHVSIHGISLADVQDAPTMEQLWEEFRGFIENKPLIAHNARFDVEVLIASLSAYKVVCPDLDFQCTKIMARAAWPSRREYGLKPLGNWLGIAFRHHDALEDARCCAQIALAIEATTGRVVDLEELEIELGLERGVYRSDGLRCPRMQPTAKHAGVGSRPKFHGRPSPPPRPRAN